MPLQGLRRPDVDELRPEGNGPHPTLMGESVEVPPGLLLPENTLEDADAPGEAAPHEL